DKENYLLFLEVLEEPILPHLNDRQDYLHMACFELSVITFGATDCSANSGKRQSIVFHAIEF
ncbi:hypothetical protein, partial [Paenibacillus riograndensis]|uniref:hypothetical protein n=1 Tax=Paenibacillus riograndensis TaxID=483937 RepID=UPI001B7FDA89